MKNVMIVDDSTYHQEQLSVKVNAVQGFKVIAACCDGADAIDYLTKSRQIPDIVFLDVDMKRIDGITAMDYINDQFPSIKVIAFTNYSTQIVIDDMFSCGATAFVIKAGVVNNVHDKNLFEEYITKDGTSLVDRVLKCVINDIPYVDERIAYDLSKRCALIAERKQTKLAVSKQYKLTKRQKQIIGLNVFEVDYNTIANITSTSKRTVETNMSNLSKKFNVKNGKEGVMAFCLRRGASVIARLRQG